MPRAVTPTEEMPMDRSPPSTSSQHRQSRETIMKSQGYLPLLVRIPNTSFGVALGLAGSSILWGSARDAPFLADHFHMDVATTVFWFAALFVFICLSLLYLYKILTRWELVVQEYRHPVRIHFMNAPHLILIMLALSIPKEVVSSRPAMDTIFFIGLIIQILMTQIVYDRWLFSNSGSSLSHARPQFFLSTVGWHLLANLGIAIDIDTRSGLTLSAFCLGVGFFFYAIVAISIFQGVHEAKMQVRGSPGLFLLIAPPSVGIVALDNLIGDGEQFPTIAQFVLGWNFLVLLLLVKIGPRIAMTPPSFGVYWAYVFPMAALSVACIRYATVMDTRSARIMALISIVLATFALCVVFTRMGLHIVQSIFFQGQWGDPLLGIPSEKGRDLFQWKREGRWMPEADDMEHISCLSTNDDNNYDVEAMGQNIEQGPSIRRMSYDIEIDDEERVHCGASTQVH